MEFLVLFGLLMVALGFEMWWRVLRRRKEVRQ